MVTSLGYRTDLIFPRFDGRVTLRSDALGDYLVVLTPDNPSFHWGNFLLFKEPPAVGDVERWQRLFAAEVGLQRQHMAFGWDGVDGEVGEVAPFLAAGFELEASLVMTAQSLRPPPKGRAEVEVRPLLADAWQEVVDHQVACRDEGYAEAGYRRFRQRQMARYQRMVKAGLGRWFGAFWEGRLVADLGLFRGERLGRFQAVSTHPDFRGRGVAGTLVFEAVRYGLGQMGLETLVIVAEEGSQAARVYASLGFARTEQQRGVSWWAKG